MEAEPKRKKTKRFFGTQPIKGADTGDSVGRFRRYWSSTLFNYHSNLSMSGTLLQKSIHLPDNCGLLATQKRSTI